MPQDDLFAAWEALENLDAYNPPEETRVWLQAHWREVVPAAENAQAVLTANAPPAVALPPVLSEP